MIDLEITIGFLLAMEKGNFRQMERLLAEDMVLCGLAPRPLCKQEVLQLLSRVRAAIPDWKSHFRDVQPRHDGVSMTCVSLTCVSMTIEVTGTHLRTLRGVLPGMPAHAPTGAAFQMPPERIEFTLCDEQITRIHIEPVPGGGIEGMLEQLGILVPAMN